MEQCIIIVPHVKIEHTKKFSITILMKNVALQLDWIFRSITADNVICSSEH